MKVHESTERSLVFMFQLSPSKPILLVAMLTLTACGNLSSLYADRTLPSGATASDRILANFQDNEEGISLDRMLRLAKTTAERGDTASAVGIYKQAAERFPTFVEPYVAMGEVFDRVGQPSQALGAYQSAHALEPDNVKVLRGLSSSYISMGRPSDAEPILVGALENAKKADDGEDVSWMYNNLGIVYDMMGSHSNAQASYMGGMRTHPNDIDLINNMALSYAMSGQYDRAIELANRSGMSPLASQRHRESQAIIYILAGYQTEARQILAADYDADLVDQRVKQYSALAKVPDTGRRAAILGGRT